MFQEVSRHGRPCWYNLAIAAPITKKKASRENALDAVANETPEKLELVHGNAFKSVAGTVAANDVPTATKFEQCHGHHAPLEALADIDPDEICTGVLIKKKFID
eukprot:1748243-Karenia_brevis.AAC.1